MTVGFRTQSLQDLLAFPFRAPGAQKKLVIAALLGLGGFIVPIVPGVLLMGYGGLIMRRVIKEDGEPYLPEWDNLSEMLVLGLKLFGAMLIYSMPIWFIAAISYFGMIVPAIAEAFSSASGSANIGRTLGLQFGGMFVWMCGFGIAMLLSIVFILVSPAIMGHVVAKDSFSAAFHFGEWWKILRANWGGFLVSMLLIAGIYAGIILVGQILYMTIVLCILFPFVLGVLSVYLLIIADVVFAQAYSEAVVKLETQNVPPPAPAEPAAA